MTKTWDEIVERVARVLYDPPPPNIYGYSAEHMLAWERAARSKAELQADAALRALIAAGLAIVPREATEEMVSKAWEAHADVAPCEIIANPGQIYEALLAAISAGGILPPKGSGHG